MAKSLGLDVELHVPSDEQDISVDVKVVLSGMAAVSRARFAAWRR
jgi:hypothetical protein